jgi:hypothetical protein
MNIKCGILEHLRMLILDQQPPTYKCLSPKAPPAPDPEKLNPNLSPLGGETTCTPVSKFSLDLCYDAVDRIPSVKRSSDTVDQNAYRQVVQGQVVLAEETH